MKKTAKLNIDVRANYDFSAGVRGKYAAGYGKELKTRKGKKP